MPRLASHGIASKLKIVAALAVIFILACSAWFAWDRYQSGRQTQAASDAVNAASAQVDRQLHARQESGMTLAEYSKRGLAAIGQLEQAISTLKADESSHAPGDRNTAISFIEQCKVLLRLDQREMRFLVEQTAARQAVAGARADFDEAIDPTTKAHARQRYSAASENRLGILKQYVDGAVDDAPKYQRVLAANEAVRQRFGPEVGLSERTVQVIRKEIAQREGTDSEHQDSD